MYNNTKCILIVMVFSDSRRNTCKQYYLNDKCFDYVCVFNSADVSFKEDVKDIQMHRTNK